MKIESSKRDCTFWPVDTDDATFATRHEVNGFLSVSPLNLTVEKREGFKRELMNWPFPFHLFLISVRLQLTFSATYQVSRPPRLRALSPTQHERSSSKLVLSPVCTDFLHLAHNYRQRKRAAQQTMTPFSRGNKSCLLENRFLHCWVSDVEVLVLAVCCLMVVYGEQQGTHYESKRSPWGHYTHSPSCLFFCFLFFCVSVTSLSHFTRG